jgi:hypothetical protein
MKLSIIILVVAHIQVDKTILETRLNYKKNYQLKNKLLTLNCKLWNWLWVLLCFHCLLHYNQNMLFCWPRKSPRHTHFLPLKNLCPMMFGCTCLLTFSWAFWITSCLINNAINSILMIFHHKLHGSKKDNNNHTKNIFSIGFYCLTMNVVHLNMYEVHINRMKYFHPQ